MDFRKTLIVAGALLVGAGLFWPSLRARNIGRLPGDVISHRPGMHVYFLIVTCIVIGIVLSLLFLSFPN